MSIKWKSFYLSDGHRQDSNSQDFRRLLSRCWSYKAEQAFIYAIIALSISLSQPSLIRIYHNDPTDHVFRNKMVIASFTANIINGPLEDNSTPGL